MNQTVGETRREMKQKFRSMGEPVWLQETFWAARGRGNKAFGWPGVNDALCVSC